MSVRVAIANNRREGLKEDFDVEGQGRPTTSTIQIAVKGTYTLYIGRCKYSVLKIERSESRGGGPFGQHPTDYYSPERCHGVLWNDPSLGIQWPVDATSAVMSDADRTRPRLSNLPAFFD